MLRTGNQDISEVLTKVLDLFKRSLYELKLSLAGVRLTRGHVHAHVFTQQQLNEKLYLLEGHSRSRNETEIAEA